MPARQKFGLRLVDADHKRVQQCIYDNSFRLPSADHTCVKCLYHGLKHKQMLSSAQDDTKADNTASSGGLSKQL